MRFDPSDMISQQQFARMWIEVRLAGEIRHAMHANVVPQERHGNDKRNEAATILLDAIEQLVPGLHVHDFLQVAGHVHQYVRVPRRRRDP